MKIDAIKELNEKGHVDCIIVYPPEGEAEYWYFAVFLKSSDEVKDLCHKSDILLSRDSRGNFKRYKNSNVCFKDVFRTGVKEVRVCTRFL